MQLVSSLNIHLIVVGQNYGHKTLFAVFLLPNHALSSSPLAPSGKLFMQTRTTPPQSSRPSPNSKLDRVQTIAITVETRNELRQKVGRAMFNHIEENRNFQGLVCRDDYMN